MGRCISGNEAFCHFHEFMNAILQCCPFGRASWKRTAGLFYDIEISCNSNGNYYKQRWSQFSHCPWIICLQRRRFTLKVPTYFMRNVPTNKFQRRKQSKAIRSDADYKSLRIYLMWLNFQQKFLDIFYI